MSYCIDNTKEDFELTSFLDQFWGQAGLKRSIDKIFEIVVYALFEVLARAIEIKVDIYFNPDKHWIIRSFSSFAEKVLNITPEGNRKTLDGHFYRAGVTNAADRGLDMYANFGMVVQVKHLSLDEDLAENVVTSITADRIIIVCKSVGKKIITSLLSQIGWRSRIQSIITTDELAEWYTLALRGAHAHLLGNAVLATLTGEIKREFPSVGDSYFQTFKMERGYNTLNIKPFASLIDL